MSAKPVPSDQDSRLRIRESLIIPGSEVGGKQPAGQYIHLSSPGIRSVLFSIGLASSVLILEIPTGKTISKYPARDGVAMGTHNHTNQPTVCRCEGWAPPCNGDVSMPNALENVTRSHSIARNAGAEIYHDAVVSNYCEDTGNL